MLGGCTMGSSPTLSKSELSRKVSSGLTKSNHMAAYGVCKHGLTMKEGQQTLCTVTGKSGETKYPGLVQEVRITAHPSRKHDLDIQPLDAVENRYLEADAQKVVDRDMPDSYSTVDCPSGVTSIRKGNTLVCKVTSTVDGRSFRFEVKYTKDNDINATVIRQIK